MDDQPNRGDEPSRRDDEEVADHSLSEPETCDGSQAVRLRPKTINKWLVEYHRRFGKG